jgi:undecaprenyl-diphosphatase
VVLIAALWGLVQGLTEFLPVSSSGHLILIPALLGVDEPDLATSAVLHLGTLAAVIAYYRRDLAGLARDPTSEGSKRIWLLLGIGTIPAVVFGLTLDGPLEVIFSEPWIVAICLVCTGAVLLLAHALPIGDRRMEDGRVPDALVVGFAQAVALLPGVSRSGMTITGGLAQGLSRYQAARYAFLLGVPAIAGAGISEGIDLMRTGGFEASLLVGTLVAAITGYVAIAWLLRLLTRFGLLPFALYCIGFGVLSYLFV